MTYTPHFLLKQRVSAILDQVALRRHVRKDDILGDSMLTEFVLARVDLSECLLGIGMSIRQIGLVLSRDRTTIYYYLGRIRGRTAGRGKYHHLD